MFENTGEWTFTQAWGSSVCVCASMYVCVVYVHLCVYAHACMCMRARVYSIGGNFTAKLTTLNVTEESSTLLDRVLLSVLGSMGVVSGYK